MDIPEDIKAATEAAIATYSAAIELQRISGLRQHLTFESMDAKQFMNAASSLSNSLAAAQELVTPILDELVFVTSFVEVGGRSFNSWHQAAVELPQAITDEIWFATHPVGPGMQKYFANRKNRVFESRHCYENWRAGVDAVRRFQQLPEPVEARLREETAKLTRQRANPKVATVNETFLDAVADPHPIDDWFTHSDDFSAVTWGEQEFKFTAERMKKAIKALYENAKGGGIGLKSEEVRRAANSDGGEVRDLFKISRGNVHPAYQSMVRWNPSKKVWQVNPPEK